MSEATSLIGAGLALFLSLCDLQIKGTMAVVWLLSENIATKHEGAAVINRKLNLYHDLF